ncbi:MAG: hypothetical protein KAG61_01720 [Bacteriovoracaceae bacterium]|nr:hypothetical protein [Bacteriovoracaceae bacterium]
MITYLLTFVTSFFIFMSSAWAVTSSQCPGEEGYTYTNSRNSNSPSTGGFISYDADITDDIWLGRNAAICGFSSVTDGARVTGRAVICGDALVHGNKVRITGHSRVCGNAEVTGTAVLSGYISITSGFYSAGKHSNTYKEPQKTKGQLRSEAQAAVGHMINMINGDFSYYTFTTSGEKRMYFNKGLDFQQDSLSDPCRIKLKEVTTKESYMDMTYARIPYQRHIMRFNLKDFHTHTPKLHRSYKTFSGEQMSKLFIGRNKGIKTESLIKKRYHNGTKTSTDYSNTVRYGFTLISRENSSLEASRRVISESIKACVAYHRY